MEVFYAATQIIIGNGCKTPFWEAPSLMGESLRILCLSFSPFQKKAWKVNQAMKDNAWVGKVTIGDNFSLEHLTQFVELWVTL
jgi:hypothetical protein